MPRKILPTRTHAHTRQSQRLHQEENNSNNFAELVKFSANQFCKEIRDATFNVKYLHPVKKASHFTLQSRTISHAPRHWNYDTGVHNETKK